MSSKAAVEFTGVWKKYSMHPVFHRSLREDIISVFRKKNGTKQSADMSSNEFWALKEINFIVRTGQTVGFYGPNGAGKSTILKLMARVTYPTKGGLTTNGRIAPLIEIGAGFHPDLSGRENILMNGAILGMRVKEIREKTDSIIRFSELAEFIEMPVKKYSSGMYLRLAFSTAIHSDADIYLIDEILSVGDESFQKRCIDKIQELKKAGKTLVIISHDRHMMEQLSDKIFFINKGELAGET